MIKEETIRKYAQLHESCYLYDKQEIEAASTKLKKSFPENSILYSVKCNPHPDVVKTIFASGIGADTASLAETELALAHELPQTEICFSCPGKTHNDIEGALGKATIIADSINEIWLISRVAHEKNITANIGVRINPAFAGNDGKGIPSKFGIDEKDFLNAIPDLLELRNIKITGLHVHVKSQLLENDDITRYWRNVIALFERIQKKLPEPMTLLNAGSGIGVPYSVKQKGPDIEALGRTMTTLTQKFHESYPGVTVFIESGRFLTCKAGTYITRVTDKKVSGGVNFIILADTLNGFVRPSLAMMAAGITGGTVPACEPLLSGGAEFTVTAYTQIPTSPNDTEKVTLCGSLCTGADVLAHDMVLPRLQPGDFITVNNAGAYAYVLTPLQFASRTAPAQILVDEN